MVKVKLNNDWFAPSDKTIPDKFRVFSGAFFQKGIREIPEELVPFLPPSAELVDAKKPEPEVVKSEPTTLKEYDIDRDTKMEQVIEQADADFRKTTKAKLKDK